MEGCSAQDLTCSFQFVALFPEFRNTQFDMFLQLVSANVMNFVREPNQQAARRSRFLEPMLILAGIDPAVFWRNPSPIQLQEECCKNA